MANQTATFEYNYQIDMNLLLVALAPVAIILFYVYFRDKYEKEPISLLLKAVAAGALIVLPVLPVEMGLNTLAPPLDGFSRAAFKAFAVAGLVEEAFKFLAVYLLIWRNKNFNEKFDGIVYAVFVSLGFAMVENILYVNKYGMDAGLTRALTAVPAHALFGVVMGYYLALAKFRPAVRKSNLIWALLIPLLLHGFYDFILFSEHKLLLLLFLPYLGFLYYFGGSRMKTLSDASIFKPLSGKMD